LIALKNNEIDAKNELLKMAEDSLENTLLNTKNIVNKLMPPLIESRGFETALDEYLEKLRLSSSLNVSFSSTLNGNDVSKEHAYELFRVVQEWIQNIIKHSKATKIDVSLKSFQNSILLSIEDNGEAFNFKESLLRSKGSGLSNIKSRLQVIGAEMKQEFIQNGNTVTFELHQP